MHGGAGRPGRPADPGARRLARPAADPGARRPDRLRQHRLSRPFPAIRRAGPGASRGGSRRSGIHGRISSGCAAGPRPGHARIAALPLRDARGAAVGWFNIAVNPIAGRPGYSFWNIQDITARHEMEAVIRDEQQQARRVPRRCADRLLLGRRRRAASCSSTRRWRNGSAARRRRSSAADDAAARFPRRAAARRRRPPTRSADGAAGGRRRRGRAEEPRRPHASSAWIGQSTVGDRRRACAPARSSATSRPEREWEAALRQSRERFQRFFASAPVGIALIDRFGRLEEANRALGDLFGAPQPDADRRAADRLCHRGGPPRARGQAGRRRRGQDACAAPVEVRLKGPRERSCVVVSEPARPACD